MRIFTSDFESNNLATEGWTNNDFLPSISTTVAHGGSRSLECDPVESVGAVLSTSGLNVAYARVFFYIDDLPDDHGTILAFKDKDDSVTLLTSLQTDGKVRAETFLTNTPDFSSVLATDSWHSLEMSLNATSINSMQYTFRVDGVQFSSGSYDMTGQTGNQKIGSLLMGLDVNGGGISIGRLYFDDIAVNDNDWPDAPGFSVDKEKEAGDSQGVKLR